MNTRLSRTKLARQVAHDLLAGRTEVIEELAAYLVSSHRQREAELVVRNVLEELERQGHIVASITTATTLGDDIEAAIKTLTGAKSIELRRSVDPAVLGGIRVATPSRTLDATVQQRIKALRERKI
jgi:F0F1-type ATP synthase delta subunit